MKNGNNQILQNFVPVVGDIYYVYIYHGKLNRIWIQRENLVVQCEKGEQIIENFHKIRKMLSIISDEENGILEKM